jgi:hypothetical protein
MNTEPTLREVMSAIETLTMTVATKEELQALASHMDERFDEMEHRFNSRFTRVDAQLIELGVEVAKHGRVLQERLGA